MVRVQRLHGALFSLAITPLPEGTHSRVGCVISKQVAASAVMRNRTKRLCREAIRPTVQKMEKPYIMAFFAKREASEASFRDISYDVEQLVKKALTRYNRDK